MELRQLEYFVAVVEEASFTRASERVLVAQSGVSAQVRRLERELGVELLERGRSITLTEAGAAVLPFARDALEAVAGVRSAVEELTGLLRGRVRIGMLTAGPAVQVTDLLARFHDAHPHVEITLIEADSDALLSAVRAGELDLAIASLAGEPDGLDTRVLIDSGIVAAVPRSHALASRDAIGLDELAAYPLICLPRGTGVRAILDAAGVPKPAFEASDPSMLARLAARGLGVAVLPEPAVGELHALELGLRGRISLCWRAGGPSSPAARALLGSV